MRSFIWVLIISCAIALGGFMTVGCSTFGTLPSDESVEIYQTSPNYDVNRKTFVNRRPAILDEMRKRTFTFSGIKEWLLGGDVERVPTSALPEVKTDFDLFKKPAEDLKVVWFGHSSVLMNFDGKTILLDPVMSHSTGPFGFMKRFQKPVVELSELPPIDVILISHDHYDHLDMDTIKFFKDKTTQFIVPLGVGSHLRGWGISEERIKELDWWQSARFEDIQIIATPAQHFSGRSFANQNKTLWASWVIRSDKHNVYFCADSGYDTHFKDIGEKYGPFDLAFIENGQYNEKWREVHLLPEESIQAYQDLKARKYFPIHWGMFNLALHSWYEPIENTAKAAEKSNIPLIVPKIGELVTVNNDYVTSYWWKQMFNAKQSP